MFRNRILAFIIIISSVMFAQNRGNNLAFQGIETSNEMSVKAAAMGGAFTSQSGSLDALFFNPAGLKGIKSLQFSVTTNFSQNKWFENQVYRPNRYFVTLPFYLEGLYIPDPAQNGVLDHLRMWTPESIIDSSYTLGSLETGVDPQSEEAADWIEEKNNSGLTHIAVAMPFNLFDYNFVAAASYGREVNINDYDRNDTYTDPHLGYHGYGEIGRVNGVDTLVVNWDKYLRERTGQIDNITAALSFQLNENISFGAGGKFSFGESDDRFALDRVGYFDLLKQNYFRFSYDTTYQHISGTSNYSSNAFNLGVHLQLEKVSAGINVELPYTISREYDYTETVFDSNGISTRKISGEDKIDMPMTVNFGLAFRPVDNLSLAIDYRYAPFSETEYDFQSADTTFYGFADQQIFSFGIDYQPYDFLSLQAGYCQTPQIFIPDGAADKEAGPKATTLSGGLGIHTDYGTLQFAYIYRTLQYYDSYFSNTNYNTINYSNLMVGYSLTL
ncbi:MAG: hypothetical protein SCALA702_14470 [Melioribacteraceae bacterium]|nr:MAG: hypothetical protein SCALA702_14470 [Melioribacteraceae bacterium]